MSLTVTDDLNVITVLKEYYGEQIVEFLLPQNSPGLKMLPRRRVSGKYYTVPAAVSGSGAAGSDFIQVKKQALNSYNGQSFFVKPGKMFASFVLDSSEHLASREKRGAFIEVFALRAELAMDDLRRALGASFYATGYGELGVIRAVDANFLYIDVDNSTTMSLVPSNSAGSGSQILFAATTASPYRSSIPVNIANMTLQGPSGYVRVTFTSAIPSTVVAGDLVMAIGGRDVNGNPNSPIGLPGWIPYVGNRSDSTWTPYIKTPFFGVDRSVFPDRLAGSFVKRGSSETYTQALLRLLKQVTRAGSMADFIIVNDDDFGIISQEALANRLFMQNINTPSENTGKNKVSQGITQFQMSFGAGWINAVMPDPFCPRGAAFMGDKRMIELISLTNTEPVFEAGFTSHDETGAPKAGEGVTPTTRIEFMVDDMYTTENISLNSGPGLQVSFQAYLAFILKSPSSFGVCVF